jgi:hypothetical protein
MSLATPLRCDPSARSTPISRVRRVHEMILIATIALALPAIVLLARLFRSHLYGVTASDPSPSPEQSF